MKIRLTGTRGECMAAIERLSAVLNVLETSAPYPNRGGSGLVRVYVDARIPNPSNDSREA